MPHIGTGGWWMSVLPLLQRTGSAGGGSGGSRSGGPTGMSKLDNWHFTDEAYQGPCAAEECRGG